MRYGQDTQKAQIWQRFACDMIFWQYYCIFKEIALIG